MSLKQVLGGPVLLGNKVEKVDVGPADPGVGVCSGVGPLPRRWPLSDGK